MTLTVGLTMAALMERTQAMKNTSEAQLQRYLNLDVKI